MLQLEDLQFYDKYNAKLDQQDSCLRKKVQQLTITFKNQKNRKKLQVIPVTRSTNTLCPVQIWAKIVRRLWSYVNMNEHTDIILVKIPQRAETFIVSKENVEGKLKAAVLTVGEDKLGIKVRDTGCHSIRATFATILQLSNEKETKIQHHGRWQSDCFETYMRRNVANDNNAISKSLPSKEGFFFTFQLKASDTQRSTMVPSEGPRRAKSNQVAKAATFRLGPLFT